MSVEIRDPVHGSIPIASEEVAVLKAPFFQRLRNIKQLGFSEYSFPGATHTRYLHSIGVMAVATKSFDQIFSSRLDSPSFKRLRATLRMATLLHDIGHAPLSHSTESAMPTVSALSLPTRFGGSHQKRQANHEDYAVKAITDSPLSKSFKAITQKFSVDPNCIAELIIGETVDEDYFTIEGINYFPILHQMVSGEMDCDRMDYLLRDSYFCGVSYGQFDIDWIIDNLDCCVIDDVAYLGLNERAIPTFDDFLLGRFHMFLMIYFHYRAVCLEKLLGLYFESCQQEYTIPADIEEYLHYDDYHLKEVLRSSQNIWAQRVIQNDIPQKIFESFGSTQLQTLEELEGYFKGSRIDFIRCSSTGRLSKYYESGQEQVKFPMKAIRLFYGHHSPHYFNINDATDLYSKFSKTHSVNRIHCDVEALSPNHQKAINSIIASGVCL